MKYFLLIATFCFLNTFTAQGQKEFIDLRYSKKHGAVDFSPSGKAYLPYHKMSFKAYQDRNGKIWKAGDQITFATPANGQKKYSHLSEGRGYGISSGFKQGFQFSTRQTTVTIQEFITYELESKFIVVARCEKEGINSYFIEIEEALDKGEIKWK